MTKIFIIIYALVCSMIVEASESFTFISSSDIHIDRPVTYNPPSPTNYMQHFDSLSPSFILMTGDIADNSCATSCVAWSGITNLLTSPVWVLPGNHDACPDLCGTGDAGIDPCSESYSNYFSIIGTNHFSNDIGSFRFIGFDTRQIRSGAQNGFGKILTDELLWVSNAVKTAAAAGKNIICCSHYPILDAIGNNVKSNQLALIDVLTNTGAGHVVAYLHGHRHQAGLNWSNYETNGGVVHVNIPALSYNIGDAIGEYWAVSVANSRLTFQLYHTDAPTYTALATNFFIPYTAPATTTRISLIATNISLPSPWTYSTSSDSPEGAWLAPWGSASSVSATVSLGQTLAPGNYSLYFKVLDYDRLDTMNYVMGGTTGVTQVLDDRDATTYWTTNVTITSASSATNLVVNFTRTGGAGQSLRWFATYITSDTNEVVMADDRVLVFRYPGTSDNDNSAAVKGNHVRNSSFENGIGDWRINNIGAAEIPRDLWSTNQAWNGSYSMRLPANVSPGYQVQQNPMVLASNKVHTISVYARSPTGTNYASIYLTSLSTAPSGYTATYSTNTAVLVSNSWQRVSVTTTNLPYYPNGQYFVTLAAQSNAGGGFVYFDGLQVEEGTLAAWAPKNDFEFEAIPNEPSQVYWTSDSSPVLNVRAWNNNAGSLTRRVDYFTYDWKNAIVDSGAVYLTAASSNAATSTIAIPLTSRGHFRSVLSITNQNTDVEATWLVVGQPASTNRDSTSYFGSHMSADTYVLQRAQRLGVKWQRALSLGRLRWEENEVTHNVFTWPDLGNFTNYGISVVGGIYSSTLPAWISPSTDATNYIANYLTNAMLHYPWITNWEIWNEPPGVLPSLAYYVQMLRVGATAIKALDSNKKVIGAGGVASASVVTNINTLLGADSNKVDIWSVHFYPPNESGALAVNRDVITALAVPAWNDETGAGIGRANYTGPGFSFLEAGTYAIPWKGGNAFYGSLYQDCLDQAKNALTCVGYNMAGYFYYDGGKRTIAVNEVSAEWTWMHYDDTMRPKAAAMAGIWSLLDKSIGKGALTVSGGSCFGHLRGSTPLVSMWSSSTNKTITLAGSVSTSDLKVYDVMGNGTTPSSLAVSFGVMPIIIEGQGSLSYSNLAFAVTNGTVTARADTEAPKVAVTTAPRSASSDLTSHFRWLAVDDVSTPGLTLQDGITYRYSFDSGGYSDWSGNTWIDYDGISGAHTMTVQARDLAGNISSAQFPTNNAGASGGSGGTMNTKRAHVGRIIKSP